MERKELEMSLGHIFVNDKLLDRALTTNGWVNEHQKDSNHIQSQEALCTLGDAVLRLILVDKLVVKGIEDSGTITEDKKNAENRKTLSRISRKFNVGECMKIGEGEKEQKIYDNDKNLAETLEALIGAIYLDVGFDAAKKVIMKWSEFERLIA
jgi:ribonuclease-3